MILLDLLGTDIGFDCVSSRRSAWVPFSGQVAGINNRKDGRQFWTSLFGLPKISSYMQSTQNIYDKFLAIQDHLRNKRLLVAHDGKGKYCKYFRSETAYGTNIADDHVPFMNKGVKILHAIVSPFPSIWHTDLDRDISLHWPTIQNLNMIFRIGVADYLGL
ncbi:unnamed protein product [Notodromas monacha]|uniref:glutaminyl-peptide cyclotransferase n=1 Tax=Notodromas monacha TaxID=399045 RepID=A0A7R9C1W1_9CRUS|nr:unnamed protein product [Notodromas monacha]CAG0924287.1 unnamed protein product [Notodromas monacha]